MNNVGTRLEVDVAEDVNKVNVVLPEQWPTLTVNELLQQKSIMLDRFAFLLEKNYSYAKDFEKAIEKIDAIIASK